MPQSLMKLGWAQNPPTQLQAVLKMVLQRDQRPDSIRPRLRMTTIPLKKALGIPTPIETADLMTMMSRDRVTSRPDAVALGLTHAVHSLGPAVRLLHLNRRKRIRLEPIVSAMRTCTFISPIANLHRRIQQTGKVPKRHDPVKIALGHEPRETTYEGESSSRLSISDGAFSSVRMACQPIGWSSYWAASLTTW